MIWGGDLGYALGIFNQKLFRFLVCLGFCFVFLFNREFQALRKACLLKRRGQVSSIHQDSGWETCRLRAPEQPAQ